MTATDWERSRRWELTRRFVYYLVENFTPREWIRGQRTVDFSGGLGDLGRYLTESGARSVTVTVPEAGRPRAPGLPSGVNWIGGVTATRIEDALGPESTDLFCARMVFQFPTWEGDRTDPDSMLEHIAAVLAPRGRAVVAVHDFFSLHPPSIGHHHSIDDLLAEVEEQARETLESSTGISRDHAERLIGLVEMVRFLGLPPREGPLGTTGFGLKIPMLVESMVRAGLRIEHAEHLEPFTYPVGVPQRLVAETATLAALGDRVMEIKRRAFGSPRIDPHLLPGVIRKVVKDVSALTPVVTVPIVRLVGRKP